MLRLPFNRLADSAQRRWFSYLFMLTVAVMACLNLIDVPLKTEAAPSGIVSFELAGTQEAAQRMVDSWDETARIYAGLSLGFDYVFMASYSTAIALGCTLAAHGSAWRGTHLVRVGALVGRAQFAAALLDAVENYGLVQVLLGSQEALWPALARWCAIPKFAIVALGLLYVILGLLASAVFRLRAKSHTDEPGKELEIRAIRPADEEQVVDLWQRCELVKPQNPPYRDIALKLQVQPELFLVGIIDGRIVATVMAGYEGHRGWINYLAVSPELRRQGLGRRMIEEAEAHLTEMGCPKINIQVRNSNLDVIAFYERLGYSDDNVQSLGKRL